ncbi:hypothetical protein E2562_031921 [Oryza meyeriana var. granulata]|uniref:Uncharacterized protein n=1 Tax=Oryza meyeriana var. granulata TaxID=110450 RepID=A0A6G1DQC1_9ORYZ|nr:hypothetical protein E2562_031921 [Oryza meyeriana var. granulata]
MCTSRPGAATVVVLRAEHLAAIDRRGRRRMDCLSLDFHAGQLALPELKRFIEYAAAYGDLPRTVRIPIPRRRPRGGAGYGGC